MTEKKHKSNTWCKIRIQNFKNSQNSIRKINQKSKRMKDLNSHFTKEWVVSTRKDVRHHRSAGDANSVSPPRASYRLRGQATDFGERGREGEKGRETPTRERRDNRLPLTCLQLGPNSHPRHLPWPTRDLSVYRTMPSPLSHTGQGRKCKFKPQKDATTHTSNTIFNNCQHPVPTGTAALGNM